MGGPAARAQACTDRFEDYIIATGEVATAPNVPTDGVWMLDYRAGKLLGTVIDRTQGKISGWAEVDLVTEFGLPPRKDVHFVMTTGMVARPSGPLRRGDDVRQVRRLYNGFTAGRAARRHD